MVDKRRGFTLIELLVVIAIIALLMAILMPALAKVRKQAKDVLCKANLGQFGPPVQMYTHDSEGYFDEGGSLKTQKWANSWRPYYKEDDLRACPAVKWYWWEANGGDNVPYDNILDSIYAGWGRYSDLRPDPDIDWKETGLYGGFGSNSWIYNRPGTAPWNWRTINVKGGDQIPLLLDCLHIGGRPNTTDILPVEGNGIWTPSTSIGSADNGMCRFMMDRHNGGIHGLFYDFSVRKVGAKTVARLKWHRQYDWEEAFPFWPLPKWPGWMSAYPEED